jgi:NAD(P)-dependent dehydrogenase (short-subunit alcohol dehydrogenase family)
MRITQELMDMSGRCAVVTGGAGHIGLAIAESLAEHGANLVLVDRDRIALESAAKYIKEQNGAEVKVVLADLEADGHAAAIINEVEGAFGGLDVLVNCAAFVSTSELSGWSEPFEEQTVETWRRAFEVNLTAVFQLTQSAAPLLRRSGAGSIINIASIYGMHGPDHSLYEGTMMNNPAAYSASKGGLLQFTRWASTVLAPDIRVNAISPGGVSRGQPTSFIERYERRVPLGRMATEEDFKGVALFLASNLSAYVTGQNIAVDGGWGVW